MQVKENSAWTKVAESRNREVGNLESYQIAEERSGVSLVRGARVGGLK